MIKILSSCLGLLLCIDLILTKASARVEHSMDEYLDEDKVTRMTKKQNYIRQRALENNALNRELGVAYTVEAYAPGAAPEELPPLIVDYANMIRNDFILLDNSVQTRTRKRGSNKVGKVNQVLLDPPCSCEDQKELMELQGEYFPPALWTTKCKPELCPNDHKCQMSNYSVTVLKKSDNYMGERSVMRLPADFKYAVSQGWSAVTESVTVGCVCVADEQY